MKPEMEFKQSCDQRHAALAINNPESTPHCCQLWDSSGEEWQKVVAIDFFSMHKVLNVKMLQDHLGLLASYVSSLKIEFLNCKLRV